MRTDHLQLPVAVGRARTLVVFLSVFLFQSAYLSFAAEVSVPLLHLGQDYFTNATLTSQSSTHVTVLHSRGMTVAKAADLDLDIQHKLGYDLAQPKAVALKVSPGQTAPKPGSMPDRASSSTNSSDRAFSVPGLDPKEVAAKLEFLRKLWGDVRERIGLQGEGSAGSGGNERARLFLNLIVGGSLLAITAVYFFFSHSCLQLCRRAGSPSAVLVWLPGWKRLALFRATNVSWWWFFLGWVIPLIGFIAWVRCCLHLCEAFQRTRWWALLMIWPLLGWPVFMLFAYTSRAVDDEPAIKALKQGYAY